MSMAGSASLFRIKMKIVVVGQNPVRERFVVTLQRALAAVFFPARAAVDIRRP
jgi:hypothetical protein